MFNFTTQTVYNSFKKTAGAGLNVWVSASDKPALRVGNTRFDKEDILDIYVQKPFKEHLASVTFNMSDVLLSGESAPATGTARIVLYIGLSMNSQDAFYANDLVYKGKPLYIEFPLAKGETAAQLAAKVVSIANKYLLFTALDKILNVTVNSSTKVKFEGVNGYQLIKKAVLQKWDPSAKTIDCCSTLGEFVDVITGVQVPYTLSGDNDVLTLSGSYTIAANETKITPGIEAFGDYNWIIHNLRLPTLANTNFWSPTKGEMPVPGGTYTLFIIRICKERDGISGEIVGARAKSVTTHVLYVLGSYKTADTPAKAMIDELTTLLGADADNIIKKDAILATKDPYDHIPPSSEESV